MGAGPGLRAELGSAHLLEERVLPQPEHHHVRPVPGPERSEKVLDARKRQKCE